MISMTANLKSKHVLALILDKFSSTSSIYISSVYLLYIYIYIYIYIYLLIKRNVSSVVEVPLLYNFQRFPHNHHSSQQILVISHRRLKYFSIFKRV